MMQFHPALVQPILVEVLRHSKWQMKLSIELNTLNKLQSRQFFETKEV